MNITQKLYIKIYFNNVLALIFLYTVYFGVVTSNKRFFSKMNLEKALLYTQLKQTNLVNRLHISKESPKEGFNGTVFQHFLDELKHGNSDMPMDL